MLKYDLSVKILNIQYLLWQPQVFLLLHKTRAKDFLYSGRTKLYLLVLPLRASKGVEVMYNRRDAVTK